MKTFITTLTIIAMATAFGCIIDPGVVAWPAHGGNEASRNGTAADKMHVSIGSSKSPCGMGRWRRTANGWERADGWLKSPRADQNVLAPPLHPAIISMLLLVLSLSALKMLPCQQRRPPEIR